MPATAGQLPYSCAVPIAKTWVSAQCCRQFVPCVAEQLQEAEQSKDLKHEAATSRERTLQASYSDVKLLEQRLAASKQAEQEQVALEEKKRLAAQEEQDR